MPDDHGVVNYAQFDPFRQPAWRHERVLRMVDRAYRAGRSTRRDDRYVRALRRFILRYRQGGEQMHRRLLSENQGLYFAYQLHETRNDSPVYTAHIIEARLLAKESDQEIADSVGITPEAVDWYERLFFNVRDRLHSHDWILEFALMPTVRRAADEAERAQTVKGYRNPPLAEPFHDCTLKFFAYYGGSFMFHYMLSGFHQSPAVARDDVPSWMDRHYRDGARRRSAQAIGQFDVNKFNVMDLFNLHARLIEIDKSSESEQASKSSIHTHVHDTLEQLKIQVGLPSGENPTVDQLDQQAAEVRDHELILGASEADGDTIRQRLSGMKMPDPPPSEPSGQDGDP